MTAEQLMDTIWQVTETNPNQAEAKVNRSPKSVPGSNSETLDLPKVKNVTANWIWASDPQTPKVSLRSSVELKNKPEFVSLVATCDNAFSLRLNGKFLTSSREWTRLTYTMKYRTILKPAKI